MSSAKAATIRIATFNVENLFSRPEFADPDAAGPTIGVYRFVDPDEARLAARIVEAANSDAKRQLTAQALIAANADIVCLQEVDDQRALDIFHERYLARFHEPAIARAKRDHIAAAIAAGGHPDPKQLDAIARRQLYPWRVVIEGNDGRGIDVGVMSKLPIGVRSHAHRTFEECGAWSNELERWEEWIDGRKRRLKATDRVFRRDCLEVDVTVGGNPLTIYVCHFKSMSGGRDNTRPLRVAEATAVRHLISQRFGAATPSSNWIVCGDLNDYRELDGDPDVRSLDTGAVSPSALPLLLGDGGATGFKAIDIMQRRPARDRWTNHFGREDSHAQLDYVLLSPAMAGANPDAVPDIVRDGLPYRVARYRGQRYPGIGMDRPKASDHCPVVVEMLVPPAIRP